MSQKIIAYMGLQAATNIHLCETKFYRIGDEVRNRFLLNHAV